MTDSNRDLGSANCSRGHGTDNQDTTVGSEELSNLPVKKKVSN